MDAPYLWITGELVIQGYAPDDDSVRFVPSRSTTLRRLQDGDRVEPDPDDGSVQLRLDGIDAPEKAFQGEAQPLTRSGAAYVTVYDSTPPAVRSAFVDLGRTARTAALGVWAADRSTGFTLTDQASIGPDGALILPELFRRATTYLASGSERGFVDWLAAGGTEDQPTEDDRVTLAGQATTLSALLTRTGTTIALTADPLDLVFAE